MRQRWALRQHSCKPFFILSLHYTAAQLECFDAAPKAVINVSCLRTSLSAAMPLRASPKNLLIKRKTAGRRILPTTSLTLLDVLLSIIVLPAARVLHRRQEGWIPERVSNAGLRRRSLTRGARPLLLCSRLLAILCCASPLSLFASVFALKRGRISEMREALPQRICASLAPCLAVIKKRRVASLCVW